MTKKEIWKPIPGYPDYEVSNIGRIRSWKIHRGLGRSMLPKILRPSLDSKGYHRYKIVNASGESKVKRVHSLVLLAFVGPRPKGMDGCHNDGNPQNNILDNLRYDTPISNSRDRIKHGTMLFGEDHPCSKFTNDDIVTIRTLYASGKYTQKELAEKYNVARPVISYIIRGITWKQVGGPISLNNWKPGGKRLAVTKEQIEKERIERDRQKRQRQTKEIRQFYARGKMTLADIAALYNYSESTISRIVNGNRRKDTEGPIKGIDY